MSMSMLPCREKKQDLTCMLIQRDYNETMSRQSLYLDLRNCSDLGLTSDERQAIAKFARKPLAVEFAKKQGWLVKDATKATTRIDSFWIVVQTIDPTHMRALNRDGTTIDFVFPGFV